MMATRFVLTVAIFFCHWTFLSSASQYFVRNSEAAGNLSNSTTKFPSDSPLQAEGDGRKALNDVGNSSVNKKSVAPQDLRGYREELSTRSSTARDGLMVWRLNSSRDDLHRRSSTASAKKPVVPAFFIFGDSTVDCGNNNHLETLARADVPPYGRDFDTHEPTGRFSNGRVSIDYLASFMGLPLIRPFLSQTNFESMLRGSNVASAGAGILLSSGSDLGQHISFIQQVQHATDIQVQMVLNLGEQATQDLISRSIHYISIGSNDYIHYYLRNVSGIQSDYPPLAFSSLLISTLTSQIQYLTYGGMIKKLVVVGIGPLGCVPHFLWQEKSKAGECIKQINDIIVGYNKGLKLRMEQLNKELPDVHITFCNVYDGLYDIVQNASKYGFTSATTACCGAGKYGGWIMCMFPTMACENASNHVWWDEFHPTDRVNMLLAESIWESRHLHICSPFTLKHLVSIL